MGCYRSFKKTGELLFRQGLLSFSAGNLSRRKRNFFYVSSSGCLLCKLKRNQIVKVPLDKDFKHKKIKPSVETAVHKSIYLHTSKKAVVHAHPRAAIALSFYKKSIVPEDAEGKFFLRDVPVINTEKSISSSEVAEKLPPQIKKRPVVLIAGHGAFAAAESVEKAACLISTLEFSCRIELYRKAIENHKNRF
ncbi:MAG: class II aldolase/adducin family protein [Elusimicrobiota bacterium]